jgi:Uma2 family endonuclease
MVRERTRRPVIYPESDGKPMAETDLHRDEMVRLIELLKGAFLEDANVYVSGNLLLYYEEGNPRASVSPDVLVVRGVPKLPRRDTYLLWREGKPPCFVIEVTSRSTRAEDLIKKRDLYARLGVQEYVLYDPRAEYLSPPLQGFRLVDGGYLPMPVADHGSLESDELGMRLALEDGLLQLSDRRSRRRLLSIAERDAEARRLLEAENEALRRRIAELEARERDA